MLRSVASFALVSALAAPALAGCSADVVVSESGPGGDPSASPTTSPTGAPTTAPTTPPSTPPVKVTYAWSSVALPDPTLSVAAIDGTSKSDVWIVASARGAQQRDPWTAYHYDGATWTPYPLGAAVGRPSFGIGALAKDKVFLGFSYSADVFELAGGSFSKTAASFSVTSGYSMSKVGSTLFVGTQENFGSGPLYRYDGSRFAQVVLPRGGGVFSVWGASADDVWIARSEGGLGHLVGTTYEDAGLDITSDVHGTAKDDVWAVGKGAGVRHYDGKAWTEVPLPVKGATGARVDAFAKDDVLVLAETSTYRYEPFRYDGKAFVADTRPGAPKTTSLKRAHVGSETWIVGDGTLHRLAPEGT